jgi:Flp pilus assembly protein TadG
MYAVMKMKFASGARRLLKPACLSRFWRRNDGAAAVEFALVVLPFLALMFAIIQTALVFFAQQTLETVTANTARQVLTGQAQNAGYSQATFKQLVCNQFVVALFNCTTGLSVDVRTYTSFGSIDSTLPPYQNGTFTTVYQPGNPGDIVVVRLLYAWPMFVSLLGDDLANFGNNSRLLIATAAFRNEPYTPTGP